MTEPPNHTTVTRVSPHRSYTVDRVYYEDVADPMNLPDAASHDTIIHEWADWWHWHIEELKRAALNKWEDEDIRRHRVLDEWVDSGVR